MIQIAQVALRGHLQRHDDPASVCDDTSDDEMVKKMFMNDSRTIAQDAVDSLRSSDCNDEYAFFCLIGMTKWTLR